jgi:hypothetical protein
MVCDLYRETGAGGLTGAGRGCRNTPMERWMVSLRKRAYGIHIGRNSQGSPRRSGWLEKDLGRHWSRSGERRSPYGARREAKEEYTTVCRQTRDLVLCLLREPICGHRLRGKRIWQHRHGGDHGSFVYYMFASAAGSLVLVHAKTPGY